jgi:hypothetical protein
LEPELGDEIGDGPLLGELDGFAVLGDGDAQVLVGLAQHAGVEGRGNLALDGVPGGVSGTNTRMPST